MASPRDGTAARSRPMSTAGRLLGRGRRRRVPNRPELVARYGYDVLTEIDQVQAQVEQLLATGRTPLPVEPDLEHIGAWCTNAHRHHWGWTRA